MGILQLIISTATKRCLSVASVCLMVLLIQEHSWAQPNTTIELKKDKPYENRTLPAEKSGNKKFTLPKRIYNNTVTHFNYYYNANLRFNEILERAMETHRDDYTSLLSFYDYDLETTAQDQVDTILYKCTAGILLHDLRSDWVDNLYMLMGKAYLLRKDFDSAQMVFQYINYAFAPKDDGYDIPIGSNASGANGVFTISTNEKRTLWQKLTTAKVPSRNESFIWMIRTYIEQGRPAEASGLIALLRSDALFPQRLQSQLDEMSAYLFYQQKSYDSAAHYLTSTLKRDPNNINRARWYYLAGQLYEMAGMNKEAGEAFTQSIRFSKDPYMEVYARLNIAALFTGTRDNAIQENLNELLKMARKDRYDVYRDIIYYAAAKLELQRKQYDQAQALLMKSIAYSNDNPIQKHKSFLLLGDMNYQRKAYSYSYRFYDSTDLQLLPERDQQRVSIRKPALQIIAFNEENIQREDSVQRIAALPEAERIAEVRKILKQLRKEQGLKEDNISSGGSANNNQPVTDLFNSNDKAEFYFLNSNLRSRGFNEFNQKWGNRPNIDNWRRKTAVDKSMVQTVQTATVNADNKTKTADSELSMETLMNSIPLTAEQKEASNGILIKSMLDNGKIFEQQLDDLPSAIAIYEELLRRFPNHPSAEEAGMSLVQCYKKINNVQLADSLSTALKTKFPDSPMFYGKDKRTLSGEDLASSKYGAIYNLFIEGKFEDALRAKKLADAQLGKSHWTPQLLYIESIYYVKQRQDSSAISTLMALADLFKDSPLAEKAITMIDVLKRRSEIEQYLTDLQVERPVETVTRQVSLGGEATIALSESNKKDSSKAGINTSNLATKLPGTTIVKTTGGNKLEMMEADYEFLATDTQYAVLVLDKVDPIFVTEARNALSRFNQERFFNKRLALTPITVNENTKMILIGPFASATEAVGYTDVARPLAASSILSWLSAEKYSFQIISPANLRILDRKKDPAAYKAFLDRVLPGKF